MQLQTTIPEKAPHVTIISLSGRLDIHYSLEIEEEINKLIEQGRINLIINLQNVEYLSSSGLRIFIATARQLKAKNGKLKLVKMPESVKKVFMVVELLDMFEIYDTDEEAISTF
jgi:anti-anti-sigma factor